MAIRQAVVANRCTRIMLVPARRIVAAALVWVVVTLIAAVPRVLIAQAEDLGNATHNGPPPIASDELSSALSQFNRGAALLEQYRYSEAAEALRKRRTVVSTVDRRRQRKYSVSAVRSSRPGRLTIGVST